MSWTKDRQNPDLQRNEDPEAEYYTRLSFQDRTVELGSDRIAIHHGGWNGRKNVFQLSLDQITGASLNKASWSYYGYLWFHTSGNQNQSSQNTLWFGTSQNKVAEDFRILVLETAKQYRDSLRITAQQHTHSLSSSGSLATELRKLKQLLDEDVLTQGEFESAKKKLLS